MPKPATDQDREERIADEIVVDAYGPEEQSLSWYCYLGDTVQFPFAAKCKLRRPISPLKVGVAVEVVGMSVSGGGFRDVFRRLRIGSKISWFSSLRNRIPLDVSS